MSSAAFTRLGDAALVVATPRAPDLLRDLNARPLPGVTEAVPALALLTLLFDPAVVEAPALERAVQARLDGLETGAPSTGRTLVVPVAFGGPELSPDLAWCAAHAGLSAAAFMEALFAAPLEVAFLGFTPGFAFLTGLSAPLRMPRLNAPRERVPAGSVALGGPWAGVYPRSTPGGWRIVGRTSLNFFDLSRREPLLWAPGDRVQFEAARD